jgi:predicted nucleic acid-binding protein
VDISLATNTRPQKPDHPQTQAIGLRTYENFRLKVGAIRGGLQGKRLDALNAAIRTCVVIPTDARVVDKWAELHARFLNRLKGEGINDLWIAACCLVQGLPLVTNNLGDFGQIANEFDDLRLVHPDL